MSELMSGVSSRGGHCLALLGWALFLLAAIVPQTAQARHLQCVPFAREASGIDIHGNALLWWGRAEGRYQRGQEPRVGAVMAFAPTAAMPLGHVAVVSTLVDDRHVLLDHANWSRPGMIERGVLAEDVSEDGDWSAVRVWYAPIGQLGGRSNPVFGFIYGFSDEMPDRTVLAGSGDGEERDAG